MDEAQSFTLDLTSERLEMIEMVDFEFDEAAILDDDDPLRILTGSVDKFANFFCQLNEMSFSQRPLYFSA